MRSEEGMKRTKVRFMYTGVIAVCLTLGFAAADHAHGTDRVQYMLLVRHMSLTRVQTRGRPNGELFSDLFTGLSLGRVAGGGKIEEDLERKTRVFNPQDQICIVGEALREVHIACMAYDTREKKLTGSKFSHTEPIVQGPFVAYMQVDWPPGMYKLWIFIEGELVAELPFKVKP